MTVSTRTPEGLPSRCPVCGNATPVEFSDPAGDATCPSCGCLLWQAAVVLDVFSRRFAEILESTPEQVSAETPLHGFGDDSLDTVELVMELEEEFGIAISEEDAEKLKTIGDAIRFIEERRRRDRES